MAKKGYFVLWYYPGGMQHKDVMKEEIKAKKFADDIIRCGGVANVYEDF